MNARLDKVVTQRERRDASASDEEVPTVRWSEHQRRKATLFNRPTRRRVAADQLFANWTDSAPDGAAGGRFALLPTRVGRARPAPRALFHHRRGVRVAGSARASVLLHVIDAADPNRARAHARSQRALSEVGRARCRRSNVFTD